MQQGESSTIWKHTPKTIKINNITLSYYDIGTGKEILVIFPDIMGTYESWFPLTQQFTRTHRIIIPMYPVMRNLKQMVSLLESFLEHLNIKTYSLIGVSLGGLLAQKYVRMYPNQIKKLLLVATGTADWTFGTIALGLYFTGIMLPEILMKYFVYITALFSLSTTPKQSLFWKPYLKNQIWKVNTRPALLSWGRCVLALCWKNTFRPTDLTHWNRPLFFVESDNDFVFNSLTRRHARTLYPQATHYMLSGANHLIWINRPRELIKILNEFLQ